ncbi:XdhC family protein [Pseudonocardia endophytica]|uniref:Xanthine dehydrogenase accessory factor n=1 Tax=Pseudonocardia endophytica TaxID=401976 RepID=A0A4R1HWW2_PSEEN|nr:XdhC family protein [Pseudonocardia endophytica]TCK27227.1 xanthine dehydrogenase accessory factor [Pseudonocardia endophytica]
MITTGRGELLARVTDLRADRTPFVLATVVRAERPTSAKPGDCALVLSDGTIDGFVGGSCAESTVRLESLRLLAAGGSELLRITPDAGAGEQPVEGLRTVGNPCLSGGTLEIFLESMVPPTMVTVFGEAPIARALVRVGRSLDYDVRSSTDPGDVISPEAAAVVVASHGRDEAGVLRAALDADVPYVALVASPRRAAGVRQELRDLGVTDGQLARLSSPAGMDIGARTAPEIALSVFAELLERLTTLEGRSTVQAADAAGPATAPDTDRGAPVVDGSASGAADGVATDPVCGMSVATVPSSLSVEHDGRTVWFCATGCRKAFLDDPARFVEAGPSDGHCHA